MAWRSQPEGSVVPTVTLKQLAVWLVVCGHHYGLDLPEGVAHFPMAGFDYVLMVVDRRILIVRARHRLAATRPSSAGLSRVRAVAQEVSSGRLIPALYIEIGAAGLSLCAEVLTSIGARLDDTQQAGTLDFILDDVGQALREALGFLATRGAAADGQPDAGPEAESTPWAESGPETVDETATEGEGGGATVTTLPGASRLDRAAGTIGTAGTAEIVGDRSIRDNAQAPVAATTRGAATGTAAGRADATMEIAAVADGLIPTAPSDAEGGTGVETIDTSKPPLAFQCASASQTRSGDIRWRYWSGGSRRWGTRSWSRPGRAVAPGPDTPRG